MVPTLPVLRSAPWLLVVWLASPCVSFPGWLSSVLAGISFSSIGPERALAGWSAATRSRNVERAHFRGRCDQLRRSADSLKDAPRIVSEAAVVGRPLSTIYADPETLPLSHGVCDGSTVSRTRKGGRRYGYGSGRACDLDLKGVGHAPRPPHPDSERTRRDSGSPVPLPTEGSIAQPFCVCQQVARGKFGGKREAGVAYLDENGIVSWQRRGRPRPRSLAGASGRHGAVAGCYFS